MYITINKRSAYAPIRYEATRPFAVQLGKAYMAEARKGATSRLAFVQNTLFRLLKSSVSKMGQENGPGPLQAESLNVQIFGSFYSAGKVIFDVSKVLAQTLLHTDADDIPCGELVFPANSFYLHFGPGLGLSDDGLDIEGAFVTYWGDRMAVDLAVTGFGQPHFLSLPMGEPMTGVRVVLDDPTKPISRALDEGIAAILDQHRTALAKAAELERQLEQQYGQILKVPVHAEGLETKGPLLHKALSLIVNCMFYLASETEDVHEDWESQTPVEAVEALRNAKKPSAVINLTNNLRNARYTKVRFVGRKFERTVAGQAIQEAQASGRKLATHFRRGHYRRQPYGPERSQVKRIFVAPMVVNADSGEAPVGRVFDVRPSE